MRFSLLIISVLFQGITLRSQTIINQADMPVANDSLRYSFTLPLPGTDFSLAGENMVWDFENLNYQTQRLQQYVSVSDVNFFMGLFFGGSSIAEVLLNDLPIDDFEIDVEELYLVFTKNSQLYAQEGYFFILEGFPIPLKYADKDEVYQFPLSYADRDSTSFSGSMGLGDSVYFERSGYRINEADGWGIITTPFGEFEALRVKTTLYESDSLYWQSFSDEPVVFRRTTIQYKWLSNDVKGSVLEASYLLLEGGSELPVSVTYRDIYREPDVVDAPLADFSASSTVVIVNESITLTNLSTPDHPSNVFLWEIEPFNVNFHDNTTFVSPEPTISFTQPGQYTITLNAQNLAGNHSTTKFEYITVTSTDPTNIDLFAGTNKIRFQNTINGVEVIVPESSTGVIQVSDLSGRILSHHDFSNSKLIWVDTNHLKSGVYLLSVFPENNSGGGKSTHRFIKY